MSHHSAHPRRRAVLLALAATLVLASCTADTSGTTGPTATGPTTSGGSTDSPSATPATETPSPSPTGSDTAGPAGDVTEAVDLCEALDPATLRGITGLRLSAGTFDGKVCTWVDQDGRGTLTMSLGKPKGGTSTATYIEETKTLDIAEEVTVAGADAAVAITITSGSGASRSSSRRPRRQGRARSAHGHPHGPRRERCHGRRARRARDGALSPFDGAHAESAEVDGRASGPTRSSRWGGAGTGAA